MSSPTPDGSPIAPEDRPHDIVVHGATGFVGRLTAQHLRDVAPPDLVIALSGRSRERLSALRDDLGPRAADWPLVVADSLDPDDVTALARSTRVVATTVGPYDCFGLPLVEACAAAGTHYADLTGEVSFMRDSIDAAHDVARTSGARIVHACGFDSVPSDLGVHLLATYAAAHELGELGPTTLVVRAGRGGISGGTIDSLRHQVDAMRHDADLRRLVLDPYALSPDRDAEPDRDPGPAGRDRDRVGIVHDPRLGGWLAPFPMAPVNTRVVRRSNALLGHAWGRSLRYRELVRTGTSPLGALVAGGMVAGLGALVAAMAFTPTRALLDRVMPDPGDGPAEQLREDGFFRIDVHTTTTTGARLHAEIAAPGDPGYGATKVMLGEAALALAGDPATLPDRAGVLTPSTGIGDVLVDRLRAAGHRYEVVAD
ncbi:saccharopine dehydrogenase family protein [Salsipaludibacter albus]|uniref:saccharopine dehydrogenase family protein n=1 Tax=Salsipaludibacter albus TaxID=2849650 RepID=UPI001EE3FD65|nr:saccharopine dehydrogenase NADP-binding domain-containing protein [Salsipaludibacter albus]MBY5162942.1 saccharopine dehydrogenase NADP-binding domain-containing protein [Salsipaludibacter albus]